MLTYWYCYMCVQCLNNLYRYLTKAFCWHWHQPLTIVVGWEIFWIAFFFMGYLCFLGKIYYMCICDKRWYQSLNTYSHIVNKTWSLQVPDCATSVFSRLSWPWSNISYQRLPVVSSDYNIPRHQARQTEASICNIFIFYRDKQTKASIYF
jgi:hypothetical protein